MESFKERVVEEKKQLSEKIVKLVSFIETNQEYNQLDKDHQNLLLDQLHVMISYSQILLRRLKLLEA